MPMAQEKLKQFRAQKRWKKGINSLIALKKFNFGKSLSESAKGAGPAAAAPAAVDAVPSDDATDHDVPAPGTKKKKRVSKRKPVVRLFRRH